MLDTTLDHSAQQFDLAEFFWGPEYKGCLADGSTVLTLEPHSRWREDNGAPLGPEVEPIIAQQWQSRARKHDATGRSLYEPYIRTPNYLFDCFAWHQLSLTARCAWHELARLYNGSNNGRLAMSSRTLAERLNCSKSPAAYALQELITYGFVEIAKGSSFSAKKLATEYRLTHVRCDVSGAKGAKTFMRLQAINGAEQTAPEPIFSVSPVTHHSPSRRTVSAEIRAKIGDP